MFQTYVLFLKKKTNLDEQLCFSSFGSIVKLAIYVVKLDKRRPLWPQMACSSHCLLEFHLVC